MAFRARPHRIAWFVAVLAAVACSTPGSRPLAFGTEECSHCHMTLSDPRFAGQLVTTTGKVIPFDDVGCLAMFVVTGGVAADRIHSLWVHDYSRPDVLLDVATVVYLQNDSIRTPMDYGIVALRTGHAADTLRARRGGRLLSWAEVLALIEARQTR